MSEVGDEWIAMEDLRLLSRSAVLSRYPGESAGREEAAAAFGICVRARPRLRALLALDA